MSKRPQERAGERDGGDRTGQRGRPTLYPGFMTFWIIAGREMILINIITLVFVLGE